MRKKKFISYYFDWTNELKQLSAKCEEKEQKGHPSSLKK